MKIHEQENWLQWWEQCPGCLAVQISEGPQENPESQEEEWGGIFNQVASLFFEKVLTHNVICTCWLINLQETNPSLLDR